MPDPHDPGWRPEYTGNSSLGNVGSGEEFGVDLYQLYRAGRILLPAVAEHYEQLTVQVHTLKEPVHSLLSVPGHHERAHARLKSLRADIHRILRVSCLHIAEAGVALVQTAAAYAGTDEEAAASFAAKLEEHSDEYVDPVRPPAPPNLYDPAPDRASNGPADQPTSSQ